MKITFADQALENFLNQRGALQNFIDEVKIQRPNNLTRPIKSIVEVIDWTDSKKGFYYWSDLHESFTCEKSIPEKTTVTISRETYEKLLDDSYELRKLKN